MLLDSNIIIYLRDPEWGEKIVRHFNDAGLSTCNIVIAEVLGYKGLETIDIQYFERLFSTMKNHPFNDDVTRRVIELRRAHNIQLPDAIIAATALINGLMLWTHNTADFNFVPNLNIFDPLTT